jgi:hypothetical protein
MKQPKYSPQEALERVKLMMKYDMGKTLNENRNVIFEQSSFNYFNEMVKTYMKYPQSIPNINFGSVTIPADKHAAAFNKGISGIGGDASGLDEIITKTFKTLANSIAMFKSYPKINEETLYDAIKGEWFSSSVMNKIVSTVSTQLKTWCEVPRNKRNDLCKEKTKNELKYGI